MTTDIRDSEGGLRILLVEDHPGDALLLKETLGASLHGRFELTATTNLSEALILLGKSPFDAVLLDLSLPDSAGLATVDRVNAVAAHVPIIVLTGLSDEQAGIEAVRRGAQDYLTKDNIRPEVLERSIRYAIQRKAGQQELQRAHAEMEAKVRERTSQLASTVDRLELEVRDRLMAEEELQAANRIMQMVSQCNEALVRIDDERAMVQEICRIILDVGGYRMAWVGYAEPDEAKTVRPVAHVGFEEGYLEQAGITWSDTEMGRGPTGSAIRLGETRVGGDFLSDPELAPWREQAVKRGFRSSIAVPLRADGKTFGALTVYADKPRVFSLTQAKVLTDLADNLAYGIVAIRTRAALRQSQMHLQRVVHSAPVIIWTIDAENLCTLADGRLDLIGMSSDQIVGRRIEDLFGERPEILEQIARAKAGQQVAAEVGYGGLVFEARYSPLYGQEGQVTGVMCVFTEITDRVRVQREVLEATERERRRIGRDLHDSIQSSLAGIAFMVSAVRKKLAHKAGDATGDLEYVSRVVRETLEQTRGLAKGLCPVDLKADGLLAALQQLASTTTSLFRIPCQFHCPRIVLVHDETAATQLYYICHEAVNNAIKHAHASRIIIGVETTGPGNMTLSVEDNGAGFDPTQCSLPGMGLRTMTYRAKMIGAALEVVPGPLSGTLVQCSLHGFFIEPMEFASGDAKGPA
ncbi:MAG: GAF domain-containing protein [Phycisphaerae bacterium]